ncbi:MAG: hypothetical protein JWN66_2344 [Sphingomonas bacterium]|nr:hypothetical protein [Sphingomonas bacterium]
MVDEAIAESFATSAPATERRDVLPLDAWSFAMADTDRSDGKTDYYARRAAQERALAERAADPSVRRVHVELASRYAEIASRPPNPQA